MCNLSWLFPCIMGLKNKTYRDFLGKFQVSSDTMPDNIILKYGNNAPGIRPPEIKEKRYV